MIELTKPYWYDDEGLPGLDFNREIVEPGTNEDFPDGAVGIRTDSAFWTVAALPLEEYRDVPIQDIVAKFWPDYLEQATFVPDTGTVEQKLYFARQSEGHYKQAYEDVEKLLTKANEELNRLRVDKPDISPRHTTQLKANNNYFVRQYELLLTATAHKAEPREDLPGLCSKCNLYITDRVHSDKWIAKRARGHDGGLRLAVEFPKDDEDEDDV